MRTDRIVKRANLKAKLKHLEVAVRASKAIATAHLLLQNVSREGFVAGWEALEKAYKAEEMAKSQSAIDAVNAEIAASNLRMAPRDIKEALRDAPVVVPPNS
jgi:hypothetical protein